MPESSNSNDFTCFHTNIDQFFTQNNEKGGKLSFADFAFHANGEKCYHVQT